MSDFDGNLARLGQLAANLRKLGDVPSRAAASASKRIEALVKAEFANESNPYGRGWAPLKAATVRRKGGNATILQRTHELARTVRVTPRAGKGIVIRIANQAGWHQAGTRHMVARPVLPSGVLPATWKAAIEASVSEAYDTVLGEFSSRGGRRA